MTLEEILERFVSGRMMVKKARYVDDALNRPLPLHESQPVALKATSSKEALPSKVAQVKAVGLNEDETTLIIKRFKTALKGRKEYPNKNKSRGKRSCFKCGKSGHFIAQCSDNDNDQTQEKKGKKERKKNYRKAKGEANIGKERDSDCYSSDSDDEGLAASAFDKSSLFPNERHTCLMAKEKKVHTRDIPNYTSSNHRQAHLMRPVTYDGSVSNRHVIHSSGFFWRAHPCQVLLYSTPGSVPRGSSEGGWLSGSRYLSPPANQRASVAKDLSSVCLLTDRLLGARDSYPDTYLPNQNTYFYILLEQIYLCNIQKETMNGQLSKD
jgi:hypothetical protein